MKKLTLLTLFCALATGAMAGDGWNESMTIFTHDYPNKDNYYRIPAITTTSQGNLIAVSDYRPSGWYDMGQQYNIGFAIKISNDGGNTWKEQPILIPDKEVTRPNPEKPEESTTYKTGISDPAIVHDPNTGKTFLFGYQNEKWIGSPDSEFEFYMYTSSDGGNTWDKGQSMKHMLPEGYKYMLQGPGSSMTYNGTIYMPIQAWHHKTDKKDEKGNAIWTSVSGIMFSKDGGNTWESSILKLPEGVSTSESNVFYHNGKLCLAAKVEKNNNKDPNFTYTEKDKNGKENSKTINRVVYTTSDNGKTWEILKEDFLPTNEIGKAETNTLSLSDKVYLVSYTKDKPVRRTGIYITTNTGKTLEVFKDRTDGYSSMTQDQDNLYILFEGKNGLGDMLFRRYDISSKEYANLNAQILERG